MGNLLVTIKRFMYVCWLSIHSSLFVKSLVGVLVAFILSLISPLRDIRLGYIHADSIGGLITQADLALALRDRRTDSGERSTKDFIILPVRHSNSFVVHQYIELFRQFPATSVLDGPNNWALRATRLAASPDGAQKIWKQSRMHSIVDPEKHLDGGHQQKRSTNNYC